MRTPPAILLFLAFLSCSFSSSAQTAASGWTYTGRVLRADNHSPVSGANVALLPAFCGGPKNHLSAIFQTTGPDGTFVFQGTASDQAAIEIYAENLVPASGPTIINNCIEGPVGSSFSSGDLLLYPALASMQMEDSPLVTAYGDIRNTVTFGDSSFSPDGKTFMLVTMDGTTGNQKQAWSYDLSARTLSPRPIAADKAADSPGASPDSNTFGSYRVDVDRDCHGCAYYLTIAKLEVPNTSNAWHEFGEPVFLSHNLESSGTLAWAGSSDGSAIFWAERNSRNQVIVGVFEFATGRRRYVIPPWDQVLTPLAARRDDEGYLFAYSTELACSPSFKQRVEWSEDSGRGYAWHRPWHVCFVRIPTS